MPSEHSRLRASAEPAAYLIKGNESNFPSKGKPISKYHVSFLLRKVIFEHLRGGETVFPKITLRQPHTFQARFSSAAKNRFRVPLFVCKVKMKCENGSSFTRNLCSPVHTVPSMKISSRRLRNEHLSAVGNDMKCFGCELGWKALGFFSQPTINCRHQPT